jgi:hypothetical protein
MTPTVAVVAFLGAFVISATIVSASSLGWVPKLGLVVVFIAPGWAWFLGFDASTCPGTDCGMEGVGRFVVASLLTTSVVLGALVGLSVFLGRRAKRRNDTASASSSSG